MIKNIIETGIKFASVFLVTFIKYIIHKINIILIITLNLKDNSESKRNITDSISNLEFPVTLYEAKKYIPTKTINHP